MQCVTGEGDVDNTFDVYPDHVSGTQQTYTTISL